MKSIWTFPEKFELNILVVELNTVVKQNHNENHIYSNRIDTCFFMNRIYKTKLNEWLIETLYIYVSHNGPYFFGWYQNQCCRLQNCWHFRLPRKLWTLVIHSQPYDLLQKLGNSESKELLVTKNCQTDKRILSSVRLFFWSNFSRQFLIKF